ncbi:uncharacterized protein M6G45_006094 isoform 1-T1 [Spheniscus humboldti]
MAARWPPVGGRAKDAVFHSSPGMPLTAPASGLRGLSLPSLALLAAWGRKGTGGALTGCGQELLRLKLERPGKGGGQPSDWSYRSGRHGSRRKKRLNWQILSAAPRARAAPITPGADRPPVRSPPD